MAEDAFVGGGGIREAGRQANYTVVVGKNKKEGLTLARAKAQAKEWLGEATKGSQKLLIKGTLTSRGKAARIKNISKDIEEVRQKFNSQVEKWNSIPKDQRSLNPNLRRNLEYLKDRYEKLKSDLKAIQETPVSD
jgi:predicted  nucleic acid-binding Zn-ribbon protein